MLYKIVISFIVAVILIFAMWTARGLLLTPVRVGRNERVKIVVTVLGSSPELEGTVESLLWFRENGTLACEIEVRDGGMDGETRSLAEILERKGLITLTD